VIWLISSGNVPECSPSPLPISRSLSPRRSL
jgi:hypothetical protein